MGAAGTLTKAKVKSIAKKQANKVFDQEIGPATAPFQEKSDILFGTVGNAGALSVTLLHGMIFHIIVICP